MSSNGHAAALNDPAVNPTHEVLKPRAEWIKKRKAEAERTGDHNMSQMHFARLGQVTEEMTFVAQREKLPVGLIRDEIAAGRLIIPANVNHPELEPMGIGGVATRCKINANIGNSAVTSNIREELDKLHTSVSFGADTVMDLSDRWQHSRDPGGNSAPQSGADRHGADLPGAEPGEEARGSEH